jgi:hypothetical protein
MTRKPRPKLCKTVCIVLPLVTTVLGAVLSGLWFPNLLRRDPTVRCYLSSPTDYSGGRRIQMIQLANTGRAKAEHLTLIVRRPMPRGAPDDFQVSTYEKFDSERTDTEIKVTWPSLVPRSQVTVQVFLDFGEISGNDIHVSCESGTVKIEPWRL